MENYDFSKRLIYLRHSCHLSIRALARATGISASSIYRWEHGYSLPASDSYVITLASFFNVPYSYFHQEGDDILRKSAVIQSIMQRLAVLEKSLEVPHE